jgi:dienelactone hydrolase
MTTTPWFGAAAALMLASIGIIGTLGSNVRAQNNEILPQTVNFPSMDGKTSLIGYVFMPAQPRAERSPAVVMMHGRAGAYSANVKKSGPYNASTLTKRHKMWGQSWASLGYVAVMVDGFAPRGFPAGFGQGTYSDRPDVVNEVTIRPLDAYGALAYLRRRPDVAPDRIGLQGWSNGGSATLAAMAVDAPGIAEHTPAAGFRADLVFYAGCGLRGKYNAQGYRPYATVLAFHGTHDEETPHERCQRLVERSRALGGDLTLKSYPGASHGFDDPGRQDDRANRAATVDAVASAQALFERALAAGLPKQRGTDKRRK